MNPRFKSQNGNILVLIVCIIGVLLLPLLIILTQTGILFRNRTSTQSLLEGACLVAAKNMSRVVINDPHFGFVSLSNYPPVGKLTVAADGEPVSVIGINTLVGTIRQNLLIAQALGNEDMQALAQEDCRHLGATIKALNSALSASLSSDNRVEMFDPNGTKITSLKDVESYLRCGLPNGEKIQSIKLTNGWLSNNAGSTVAIPLPQLAAKVHTNAIILNEYKAFTNIPVGSASFTFAGLSHSASLSNPANFHEADNNHICSIVKLDCVLSNNDSSKTSSNGALRYTTCSTPGCNPDVTPPGVMTLRLPEGAVAGIRSWGDLLDPNTFFEHNVAIYESYCGDYPLDSTARVVLTGNTSKTTTAREFAEHLYCWLRNGHTHPHIDAVLNMVADSFGVSAAGTFYVYEFERNGTISRRAQSRDPFPMGVTSDGQTLAVADTRIRGATPAIVIFRNAVKNLGTLNGGKHAGQPLLGYPINWCERQEFGCDENSAALSGKGKMALGLAMSDTSDQPVQPNSARHPFQSFDGRRPCLQPRQTYYSGGLAVDIEIGGTSRPDPNADVLRMRRTNFHRKV